MTELKSLPACPYCGNTNIADMPNVNVHDTYKKVCRNCGATAYNWSSRPIESALEAQVKQEQEYRESWERTAEQIECDLDNFQSRLKKTVEEIYHINFDYPLIEQVLTIFHTNFPEVLK